MVPLAGMGDMYVCWGCGKKFRYTVLTTRRMGKVYHHPRDEVLSIHLRTHPECRQVIKDKGAMRDHGWRDDGENNIYNH